jgi:alpha-mannosidase
MLRSDHPFLQITPPRVANALGRLKRMIWHDPNPVRVSFSGSHRGARSFADAVRLRYDSVTLPFTWGTLFETGWFHLRFPDDDGSSPRYLHWHDQGEGTLFLDETPYYGFDVAHRFVRLPDGVTEGWMESLCLQSAIWHPDATGTGPSGSKLTAASLVRRNDAAWQAWNRMFVLYDLAKSKAAPSVEFAGLREEGSGYRKPLENVSVLLRRILRALDDAVNAFDAGGVEALLETLDRATPLLRESPIPVRGVLTGHAHIDLVWLWPEDNAEFKARHTFASMNRLMDDYPEFRFAYSQSASYEAVQRTCPALMDAVRRRVKEGSWEGVGASYVEMDNLLPCGEALVRSFLVGQETFRSLLGETSSTLWLPDVFGYAGCLPQIMRQCGVDRFFTTKLTWSNINRFPYSSFIWRGTDGSEVLTHVTQELGYHQDATPTEGRAAARAYLQSDVHDAFLQPVGYGDGGGGATPEMCERARLLAELSGVPKTRWGRIDEFFDDLERVRERLPHYQGELYLEYHRGTFTTHGDLKAAFRGLERALQVEEAAHALIGLGPVDAHTWKRLLFSQFHDYIPGSSIREVYHEGVPELRDLASKATNRMMHALGNGPAWFNPLPMPRTEVVCDGDDAWLVSLPPLSATCPMELPKQSVILPKTDGLSIQSDRVRVELNEDGEISSLVIDGIAVQAESPLNQLWLHPDLPHKYPAWDIDRQTLSLGRKLDTPVELATAACAPGQAGITFRRKVGEASTLELTYLIDVRHPVVQITLDLDWQERDAMLRAVFPTRYRGRYARFGSPYNSVLRGQQPGDPRDEAMFEACASRWAVVCDDNQSEGLHLVTEAKYGMGCHDGVLGLSLVRSVRVSGEPGAYFGIFHEGNRALQDRDAYSDRMHHTIRYAIGRFNHDQPRTESPTALADLLYTPPLKTARTGHAGLLGIDGGESLVPAWAMPLADGSWILRLHETLGRSGNATLQLADGWSAIRTNLAGNESSPLDGPISFRPYEIVSIQLQNSTAPPVA